MIIKHLKCQVWENNPEEKHHASTCIETMITAQGKTFTGFHKEEGWLEWGVRAGVVREVFERKSSWN